MLHLPAEQASPHPVARERVVTLIEACAIAGISPSTMKRARSRGELRVLRMSPRRVGVRLKDLYAWIENRPDAVIAPPKEAVAA